MDHSGSDKWGHSRWNTRNKNSHPVGDQLIDLQKQVILKCGWNSQFCITPVRFSYSAYSWEQIKFHLQDIHDNPSLNVQLLQKEIFETFSKSLPSSSNLETLAEQLADQLSGLDPWGWFQSITYSIGSGAIMLIIILVIIFVLYRYLSATVVQTKQTKSVRAFFTESIYSHPQWWKNKKGGIIRGRSTLSDPTCCIFFFSVPFLKHSLFLISSWKTGTSRAARSSQDWDHGKEHLFGFLQWLSSVTFYLQDYPFCWNWWNFILNGWVIILFGEGNGNLLQCSCLENPRDGGAWWAAVYGVAQSQTRLKWLSSNHFIEDI